MTINFRGFVFDDSGAAVSGASVKLLDTGTTTQEGSTATTDSNGLWYFDAVAEADGPFDVEITKGSSVRRIRWDDQIHLKEIDVQNNTGNTTPAATFTNYTNNVANDVAHFRSLRGTGAANDVMYIRYYMDDAGDNTEEVARMTIKLNDATAGSGDAQVTWGVLTGNAIVDVFTISSSSGGAAEISYEVDSFTIKGGEAEAGVLYIFADQGDDAGDEWKINVADGGVLTIGNDINSAGTYVTHMTLTPNSTVASSTVAFAGSVTVVGEVDAATLDLSSSADIAGDLVLSGGADGALQFTNAGEHSIKIPDNQASALIIEEANNAYITFVTTDSSEAITVAKATTFSAGIADSGTIAAGTWNGTDIGVAYGGTGASSLTDGGVLLGSGTGAITAMAVLTDGQMIVGDGTTDPVAESGATLRTSIGVGTTDNVEFAAITGTTIDATTDFTIGTTVITDDSIVMTPSTSDTVTIAAATNGVLNVTTVDNAAAAANLNVTIDGAITLDAAGNIEMDSASGIWIFEDGGTEVLRFTEGNSGDVTVKLAVNGKDLVFTDNGDATGLTIKDAAAGIVVPGEVMTTKISYTDGDDAMTIADGGGVTFPVSIDITGSAGIILENDETITNSTNGLISLSGNLAVPDGGTVGSASDTDAITISSGGVVTFSQNVALSGSALLDSTPTDGEVSGITGTFTAGEDLELGECVYLKASDAKMWKAVSGAGGTGLITAEIMCVAMCAGDVSADAAGTFLLQGFIRADTNFPTYAIGETLYLPEAEVGGHNVPEGAKPDSDGDFIQVVGWAVTADSVFFNPSYTIIEHA